MNGYEATHEVKSFRPDLPIIAVPTFAMTEDREMAIEAGCDDYLTKPFSRDLLLERLKKYVGVI
jgi:two-component system cell cycle response regulator DivK